jgi:hypothetical protein
MKHKPTKDLKIVDPMTKQEKAAQLVDLMTKATGGDYLNQPAKDVARLCMLWILEHKTELHIENVTLLAKMVNFPARIDLVEIPGHGVSFVELPTIRALVCHNCAKERDLIKQYDASVLHVLAGQGGPLCYFCGKDHGGADIELVDRGSAHVVQS